MCTASAYMCACACVHVYLCICACTHAYSAHVPMCGCMSIASVTQELNVDVTGLELSPAAAQCAVLRLEQLAVNKVSGRRSLQVAIQWVWPSQMHNHSVSVHTSSMTI